MRRKKAIIMNRKGRGKTIEKRGDKKDGQSILKRQIFLLQNSIFIRNFGQHEERYAK